MQSESPWVYYALRLAVCVLVTVNIAWYVIALGAWIWARVTGQ